MYFSKVKNLLAVHYQIEKLKTHDCVLLKYAEIGVLIFCSFQLFANGTF